MKTTNLGQYAEEQAKKDRTPSLKGIIDRLTEIYNAHGDIPVIKEYDGTWYQLEGNDIKFIDGPVLYATEDGFPHVEL